MLEMQSLNDAFTCLQTPDELLVLEDVVSVVQNCRKQKNLANARRAQVHLCNKGLESYSAFGNYIVPMFVECGSMSDAEEAFNKLTRRKEYAWTSLIQGFIESGKSGCALNLFPKMLDDSVQPTVYTLQALVKACSKIKCLELGQELHFEAIKSGFEMDPFMSNTLVVMYAKCGALLDAENVFNKLPDRDVITWNALISGYSDLGLNEKVLKCLETMQNEGIDPNVITFTRSLKAYGNLGDVEKGQMAHCELVIEGLEQETLIGSTLVDMYAKCNLLEEAGETLEELEYRGVVAWSALISGYAEHGLHQDALSCFQRMLLEGVHPDSVACICILKACTSKETIINGYEIHAIIIREGFEEDKALCNALVDMYAKCGLVLEARDVLEEIHDPGIVPWNSLMSGYLELGLGQESLDCLHEIRLQGLQPNEVTMLFSLKACALIGAIDYGRKLHKIMIEDGLEKDLLLGNSMMDVYAKSGSLVDAHDVFYEMPTQDAISWNTLFAGYARQGESGTSFRIYDEMLSRGIRPDDLTLLNVLALCSHTGLVNKGLKYYNAMCKEYDIYLTVNHHNCMIDLLGRAGQINEAFAILERSAFQPNLVTWKILLGGCRKWCNVELGRRIFEYAVRSNQNHAALYIIMYNLYADAHMWDYAKEIEIMRIRIEADEKVDSCWIEICGFTYAFDRKSRRDGLGDRFIGKVQEICNQTQDEPQILHYLMVHGNKCQQLELLALGLALTKLPSNEIIRFAKNSCICQECHSIVALVSKLQCRTVICRDAQHLHVFNSGQCSCQISM